MRKTIRTASLVMVFAIALSMAACKKKKTYTKITPDEFSRKLQAEGYTTRENEEQMDHVIRSVAAVSNSGIIAVYNMYESVDMANEYWDQFEAESKKQNDAGTLTDCKFSENEAYIEDPTMCSIVIRAEEMMIIVVAIDKDSAEDCLDILGY